jgi:hypothetical protein
MSSEATARKQSFTANQKKRYADGGIHHEKIDGGIHQQGNYSPEKKTYAREQRSVFEKCVWWVVAIK